MGLILPQIVTLQSLGTVVCYCSHGRLVIHFTSLFHFWIGILSGPFKGLNPSYPGDFRALSGDVLIGTVDILDLIKNIRQVKIHVHRMLFNIFFENIYLEKKWG